MLIKQIRSVLSIVLFIVTVPLYARIIKTNKISTVLKEAKKYHELYKKTDKSKKLMIIFDIDNTLTESDNHDQYGSDQWLHAHVERVIKQGVPVVKAWAVILPLWFEIQKDSKFSLRLIEKNTLQVFKEAQKISDKTIGLTARGFPIISDTLRLLKKIDINFLHNSFSQDIMFDSVMGEFTQGIFFCSNGDKGKSLIELLKKVNYFPDTIIFVDDKEKYLLSVEQAVQNYPINFLGIHYTHLEEKVKNFNFNVEINEYMTNNKISF